MKLALIQLFRLKCIESKPPHVTHMHAPPLPSPPHPTPTHLQLTLLLPTDSIGPVQHTRPMDKGGGGQTGWEHLGRTATLSSTPTAVPTLHSTLHLKCTPTLRRTNRPCWSGSRTNHLAFMIKFSHFCQGYRATCRHSPHLRA